MALIAVSPFLTMVGHVKRPTKIVDEFFRSIVLVILLLLSWIWPILMLWLAKLIFIFSCFRFIAKQTFLLGVCPFLSWGVLILMIFRPRFSITFILISVLLTFIVIVVALFLLFRMVKLAGIYSIAPISKFARPLLLIHEFDDWKLSFDESLVCLADRNKLH